jgi:hypothetical protein
MTFWFPAKTVHTMNYLWYGPVSSKQKPDYRSPAHLLENYEKGPIK